MKTENKSVKRLEVGKDYINMDNNNVIVIDRVGDFDNKGFCEDLYKENLLCTNYKIWREATPEEVRERFEAHLVKRYGEDWKTMKIKEEHPSSSPYMIMYGVEISKKYGGWNVWNKNGLIYCEGVWAERLEEEEEKEEVNIRPSETQIGGSHYSDMAIQPIEFIHKNGLSFIQGNIIKYVCRYKAKGGIEDLQKAKHFIDLLIEFEDEN